MKKPFIWMGTGMILGSLLTAPVLAGAESLSVVISQFKLMVNGVDKTNGGSFWNGQAQVPLILNYEGTTYAPVKYLSEALGTPVQWDGDNQTIWVGSRPDSSTGTELSQPVKPDANLPVTFTPLSAMVYDATDTNLVKVSVAVRNDGSQEFNFGAYQSEFVSVDGTSFTGSMYVPQGFEYKVPPKTTKILQYYTKVPKGTAIESLTLHLTKADFSVYPAQFKTWASIPLKDTGTAPGTYSKSDNPFFVVIPYGIQLSIENWGYQNRTLTQTIHVNVQTGKDQTMNAFPNATDLVFELVDGNGTSIAKQRYAVNSSANSSVPVLNDGDQYVAYTVDWGRYNKTGAKILVWDMFGDAKRLLGTFMLDLSTVYPDAGRK